MKNASKQNGFRETLRQRILTIKLGARVTDRLRLIPWAFFESIPRRIMQQIPPKQRLFIEWLKSMWIKDIQVLVYGCKFRLIDSESLSIILPRYEKLTIKFLINLLRDLGNEKIIFVDVGAHIGKYTILMAKLIGKKGIIIAVEPHPENYAILVENINLNGLRNVITLPVGLWSSEGEMKLFIYHRHGWHSFVKDHGLGSIHVKTKTLDSIIEELQITGRLIIKIDVEGAELEVFKGSIKTLQVYRPIIICEIKEENYFATKNLTETLNYRITRIEEENYSLQPL